MIGLAMIARNGASTMIEAIEPFLQVTDEISIVLGGDSEDATPEIAQEYATVLSSYQGHSEYPFHFGDCRQQSFDQMTADWVIVVDADDQWQGAELLPGFIDEAEEMDVDAIYVKYTLPGGEFYQPRVFRRGAGQWVGAVHEMYQLPPKTKVLKTDDLNVTQTRKAGGKARGNQNIILGELELERSPNDLRVISHLIKDYIAQADRGRALELCNRYLDTYSNRAKPGHYDTEYLSVLHAKAECQLLNDDYEAAANTALKMLQVKGSGSSWSVFAESCQKMAHGSEALLKLAVFASEQALYSGNTRDSQLYRPELSGSVPCLIKAYALHELGNDGESIKMIDLGLMIDPHHEQLLSVHRQLSEKIERQKYGN